MKNIAIMGFKASGKSHVARFLSKKLGLDLLEIDDLIIELYEKETGEKLCCREIHLKKGAAYFRNLESLAVEKIVKRKNCVVGLGGGTVVFNRNGERLKQACVMIYLMDSWQNLLDRIKSDGIPAFLDSNDLEGSMKKELARRIPFYEKYADIIVDGTNLSLKELEELVLQKVKGL